MQTVFKSIMSNRKRTILNVIYFVLNVEIRETDSKLKSEMGQTPMDVEVKTPIDSPEKLLPDEWIY